MRVSGENRETKKRKIVCEVETEELKKGTDGGLLIKNVVQTMDSHCALGIMHH